MNFENLKKTFIVAEIGNNHEGSFELACKLINKAKEAGVDAVKFQTFKTEDFIHPSEKKRFKILKKFELTNENFYKLSVISKKKGLKFISTPFDLKSAVFLSNLVDLFKIASGDNNYNKLIETVLKYKKPTLISTGLLNFTELLNLYKFIKNKKFSLSRLAFLHCVSAYPVPDNEINLLSIKFLKEKFPITVGFSDHTLGLYASVAAIVLGAKIVEKHFTIDNNFSRFRDHKISLNPHDMKKLVNSIRLIEKMLGKNEKKIQPSESKNLFSIRRSLYASRNIYKNSIININDVSILRPLYLLNPNHLKKIINNKTKTFIKKDKGFSFKELSN